MVVNFTTFTKKSNLFNLSILVNLLINYFANALINFFLKKLKVFGKVDSILKIILFLNLD